MVAVAVLTAMVATSCGNGSGPVDEWETIWRNTVSTVTEATTSDVTPDQCEDVLGYLRVQRTVLTPVPIDDLETPIDRWFSEAESVFFDCDLDGDAAQESLLSLEALQGEVESVIEVEA